MHDFPDSRILERNLRVLDTCRAALEIIKDQREAAPIDYLDYGRISGPQPSLQ